MTPELLALIQNLAFLLVGGGIGYLVAKYFARQASDELDKIAQAFAELAEQYGFVKWTRDANGRITFFRTLRASVRGRGS